MADIFISYAREDLERVKPIVEELKKRGWSVFFDVESMQGGASWPIEIDKALVNSRCVLVFWSFNSVDIDRHPHVWGEAEKGRKKGILVPVRIDSVEPPTGFGHIYTLDLFLHLPLNKIVEAITAKVPLPSHAFLSTASRVQPAIPTTLKIGDKYGGGKVAWLDSTGKHGLIAAEADLPYPFSWYDAKKACNDLRENGYKDWYLPSKGELYRLYLAKNTLGGFVDFGYWSSTEGNADNAWDQSFHSGGQNFIGKHYGLPVRPVRSF